MKKYLVSGLLCISSSLMAQNSPNQKGPFFAFWGYNRSAYLNSDIKFVGPGYDFTLENVVAKDAPTPLKEINKYINPALFSIPQFNFHVGYFIKDNLSVSIGWDHMKYVQLGSKALNKIAGIKKDTGPTGIPKSRNGICPKLNR